jgi:hypothetical protein
MDLIEISNLRKRAFGYTAEFAKSILKYRRVEKMPSHEELFFLGYSICAPLFLVFVIFLPSLFIMISMTPNVHYMIRWGIIILFLSIFFEIQLKAAMNWYRKTCLAPIDLKR